MQNIYQRSELLLGKEIMSKLENIKVIIFGIGGVGSWCAESLLRTGIVNITIVDSDKISYSNINRQLHATTKTVGISKTEALKNRLLEINPNAKITALEKIFDHNTADDFKLNTFDFIVDAIDSLENKILLIRKATATTATFLCSMGAALRIDPTQIKVAEFWKVKNCHFARRIRKVIRKGELPHKKFRCIYSDELLPNLGFIETITQNDLTSGTIKSRWDEKKASINGSLSHITAIYGFTLAGLIVQDIYYDNQII